MTHIAAKEYVVRARHRNEWVKEGDKISVLWTNDPTKAGLFIKDEAEKLARLYDGVALARIEGSAMNGNENQDMVDVIADLAAATKRVASAITPNIAGTNDATGGHVESLTESIMGVSTALCRIADAIESVADAIRDR